MRHVRIDPDRCIDRRLVSQQRFYRPHIRPTMHPPPVMAVPATTDPVIGGRLLV